MLAGHEHAFQVHRHQLVPNAGVHVDGLAVAFGAPDVVVQDVDAAVALDASGSDGGAVGLLRDVRPQHRSGAAVAGHRCPRGFRPLLVDIDQQQRRSLLREALCHGTAVAHGVAGHLAGADDDGHLALQSS
jgi:hypothetical protein